MHNLFTNTAIVTNTPSYYRQNKNQGYCHFVIAPKLKKLGLDP